eukprot:gnl/TRDRNA2_/TRDRNA2_145979_c0_seq1.p2 gnl/TRDRNA2_/TRDRNA2_145979_c0~~gnl/TRDRNA2_/TRDRNA2_145979_c0_seq1.p2  ORF type:complete len:123 (-),score=18.67 gnl/TRDRNA2_/TRDRNA2_145979_c0_seq1:82-450(-)
MAPPERSDKQTAQSEDVQGVARSLRRKLGKAVLPLALGVGVGVQLAPLLSPRCRDRQLEEIATPAARDALAVVEAAVTGHGDVHAVPNVGQSQIPCRIHQQWKTNVWAKLVWRSLNIGCSKV